MSEMCSICSRKDREDIEQAIISMSADNNYSIEQISAEFDCDIEDLKTHALFHTPATCVDDILNQTSENTRESLTRKMKLREADILSAVNDEYLVTLKSMGRRIKKLTGTETQSIEDDDKAFRLTKLLTKPMTDLYLGLGSEIRQNVKTMADIDRMLNGPEDSTSSGLIALAEAIKGSATE